MADNNTSDSISASTKKNRRAPQIFVSYASEDAETVRSYIEHLESQNYRIWWDGVLKGGEDWSRTINTQLENSDAVLIFWSHHSVASPWVRIEANHARQHECIVPIRLDDVELPDEFRLNQTIDVRIGTVQAIERMIASIDAIVARRRDSRRQKTTTWLAAALLLCIFVASLFYYRQDINDAVSSGDHQPDKTELWDTLTHAATEQDLNAVENRLTMLPAETVRSFQCVIELRRYQLSRRDGDLAMAESQCKFINPSSANVEELEALGWLHLQSGKLEVALTHFESSLNVEPTRLGGLLGRAVTFDYMGRIDKAESAFAEASVNHPGSWRIQNAAGAFFQNLGEIGKARDRFSLAATLSPNNTTVLNNLGVASLFAEDYPAAVKAWNSALQTTPMEDRGQTLVNVGSAYYLMRDFVSARTAFEQATRILGDDYRTWANLADTLNALKENEAAVSAYARALDRAQLASKNNNNDPSTSASIASFLAALSEPGAIEMLESATVAAPQDPEIRRIAALTYLRSGDLDQARAALKQALEMGYPASLIEADYQFDGLLAP